MSTSTQKSAFSPERLQRIRNRVRRVEWDDDEVKSPDAAVSTTAGGKPPGPRRDRRRQADVDAPESPVATVPRAKGLPTPARLAKKFRALDSKSCSTEDEAVRLLILKGQVLETVKARTKGKWGAWLAEMGLNSRVASRLKSVAALGRCVGLNESDLISRLPHDLLKLERLAGLDRDQLRGLLAEFDCRQASRADLIRAINQRRGLPEPAQAAPVGELTLKAFDRHMGRFLALLERLVADRSAGAVKERARVALARALDMFEQSPEQ